MLAFKREHEPSCLEDNKSKWTDAYVRRRADDDSASFQWNSACYQIILASLLGTTGRRCAFCDGPLGSESRETVEHFHPKTLFPALAFDWDNLFPCCDVCQSSKREEFDPALLNPCLAGYDFYDFFIVNHKTGEICPSPAASPWDRLRARYTIELYNLNKDTRLLARRREREFYSTQSSPCMDDYHYRWFLE
jgi:uncharacterized protein (TIGR02646 family)